MDINEILKERFGFEQFKAGQEEVIQDVISKKDTIAILPTGSGKSLCYQLPAYLLSGTVLIVSPLVALMEDQVAIMKRNGEKRVVALNSFLSFTERTHIMQHLERYKFVFVSPEMLLQSYVLEKLKQLSLALIVVDEAHCISQWGFDFRPDYLRLGEFFEDMERPNILALTATADDQVLQDIIHYLRLDAVKVHKYSLDRPNISYVIQEMNGEQEKTQWLQKRVKETTGPGIVYVASRRRADELANRLNEGGASVASYHAGMSQEDRAFIQDQFINDEIDWICATNAFGMGIHKDNVRQVIHEHIPATIASYAQEVGRAGRDGKLSVATLIYSLDDIGKIRFIMHEDLPKEEEIRHFNELIKSGVTLAEAAELVGMSETGIRVVQYYLERLSLTDTISRIKEQGIEKEKQLQKMMVIIQSEKCIREAMLEFFGERKAIKPASCCSICGEMDHSWIFDLERKDGQRQLADWSQRLGQLLG